MSKLKLSGGGEQLRSHLTSIKNEKRAATPAGYVAVVRDLEAASPVSNQEHITRYMRELYYSNDLLSCGDLLPGLKVPNTATIVTPEVKGLEPFFSSAGFCRGGSWAEVASADVGHALVGRDLLNQGLIAKAALYTQVGDMMQAFGAYVIESARFAGDFATGRWQRDVGKSIAAGDFRQAGAEAIRMYTRPARAAYGSATLEQQAGNLMGFRLRNDVPLSKALSLYWNLEV